MAELSDGSVLPDGVGEGEEVGGWGLREHFVSRFEVEDLEHRLSLTICRRPGGRR